MDRLERRFQTAATTFLAYNILVIVWGALVRATGSGAGCGNHWPLCNGEWLPSALPWHTVIELTHRVMSGISLTGAVALWLWSLRIFRKGSLARWSAAGVLIFMLSEALIGAGLVLLKLVAQDSSVLRASYLSLHLCNTFLLLAALTTLAWTARRPEETPERCRRAARRISAMAALAGTLLVGVTGGIAALGDTLFPAQSLREGMAQDASSAAHFLIRLRVLHPLLAVAVAAYLIYKALHEAENSWGTALLAAVVIQVLIGAWNLYRLAPIFLQLIHLFMADLVWVFLILYVLASAEKVKIEL